MRVTRPGRTWAGAAGAMFLLAIAAVGAPAAAAATAPTVSITQPPTTLAPTRSFTSKVKLTNSDSTATGPITFTITLPRLTSSVPHPARTVTLAAGVTCTTYTPRYGSTRKTCTVPSVAAATTMRVAKVAFVPPTLSPYPYVGVTTSFSVSGPANSTSATYRWRAPGPPNLVPSYLGVSPYTALAQTGPITVSGAIADAGYGAAGPFAWRVDLPAGSTDLVQPSAIAGTTCVAASDGFDCSTNGLANGASFTYSFTFTAPVAAGAYHATISLDTGNAVAESNELDNASTSGTINVTGNAANLVISASNPANVAQYSVFTRTVTVKNSGGATAANVAFADYMASGAFEVYSFADLPSGVTCSRYVTYSGRPTTAHYHGVRCTVGPLNAGQSAVVPYQLVVKGSSAATYTSSLSATTTSYTDPSSTPSSTTSVTVYVPATPNPPLNLTAPAVSGDGNTGSVLSATTGTWTGAGTITYGYAWQRCDSGGASCSDIPFETDSTYTVGNADIGSTLRVLVTATNLGGGSTTPSTVTPAILPATAPSSSAKPQLAPGLESQPTYAWSVTDGTWDGTPTITYAYQWQRCNIGGGSCVDIADATSSIYVLQDADVFHSVRARVAASNTGGSSFAYSNVSPEIDPLDQGG